MSNNHHTPITTASPANASTFNTPLGELDQAVTDLTTGSVDFQNLNFDSSVTNIQIVNNRITPTEIIHTISPETGSEDILSTITYSAGRVLFLKTQSTNDKITISNALNIKVRNGLETVLTGNRIMMFIAFNNIWQFVSDDGYVPSPSTNYTGTVNDFGTALNQISKRYQRSGWINGFEVDVENDINPIIRSGECVSYNNSSKMFSNQFNISTAITGIGGLDTGTVANNTIYYVWIMTGPTTSAVLSTSSTAAGVTIPVGYGVGRLIGAVKTDGSGNLLRQKTQYGQGARRLVTYRSDTTASPFLISNAINVTNGAYDTIDLSSVVPVISREAICYCSRANAGGILSYRAVSTQVVRIASVASQSWQQHFELDGNRQFEITSSAAGDEDFTLMVTGYYIDLTDSSNMFVT